MEKVLNLGTDSVDTINELRTHRKVSILKTDSEEDFIDAINELKGRIVMIQDIQHGQIVGKILANAITKNID